MTLTAAAGWVLAAFFAGALLGGWLVHHRAASAPAESTLPSIRKGAGTDTPHAPAGHTDGRQEGLPGSGDPRRAEELARTRQEWRNFLDYDGTVQAPPK